jgi:hypothetical protein
MTEEQYQVLTTANTEPTEYVYHYAGQKINVTFITNLKGAVNYNFVAYPKTGPILIYSEGMVTEHQTLERHLDSRYLVLDLFAVAVLLYLTIYPYYDDEVIQTKSS